jgi:hypothetical protein
MNRRPSLRAAVVAVALLAVPTSALAVGPPAGSTAPTVAPLVADAGASPVVLQGDDAVVMGAGWGGVEPYTFAWSTEAGTVRTPSNYATGIDTTDVEPGIHTATLTVTDQAGTTATEELAFVVVEGDGSGVLGGDGFVSLLIDIFTGDPDEEGDDEVSLDGIAPVADAGGPYEFVVGATQTLTGTVAGGTAPYAIGWDLNLDGQVDVSGPSVTTTLDRGHHLVRFLVRDADGLTSQQMTSVIVGTDDEIRDATVPLVVIGMSDSGINPYHAEFSAATYPDEEVLRLTRNFTRHPSEYIPGFPRDATALPISLDAGYYPEDDQWIFHREIVDASPDPTEILEESVIDHGLVRPGELYWVPGTKIIGASTFNGYGAIDDGPDPDLILDGHGHGTGSASVATGNRYGYCPTCLLFFYEGLWDDEVYTRPFVDITSHSHGYVGGLPMGLIYTATEPLLGDPTEASREAAERGVTILFSSGNGIGNAFDVPNSTIVSDQTGPTWTLDVGAVRRDTQGAIIGDGTPAHISSWGDGFLPSACRTGIVDQCAFSGTSAASPYTAGVFGHVLRTVRDVLGDGLVAPRDGQVVAQGRPVPGSPFLEDGILTRGELRAVVLKTAAPLPGEFSPFAYPGNWTEDQARFLVEGYGAATPNHADRAIAVLLGEAPLPDRAEYDEFFMEDCELRDGIYGDWDRTGDGEADGCDADAWGSDFAGTGSVSSESPLPELFAPARDAVQTDRVLTDPITYHLHRVPSVEPWKSEPSCGLPQTATEGDMDAFLSRQPAAGESEVCFDSRITSSVTDYRPKGMYGAVDTLEATLPAGSEVDISAFMQSADTGPAVVQAHLVASDRIIGSSDMVEAVLTPAAWTEVELRLTTDRLAVRGEQLSLHFTHVGAVEWAFGHGTDAPSQMTITPAPNSPTGLEFGVTIDEVERGDAATTVTGRVAVPHLGADPREEGYRPVVTQVQVAVGDDSFGHATFAVVDAATGSWTAVLPAVAEDVPIHARALRDTVPSDVVTAASEVTPAPPPLPATGGGTALLSILALALIGGVRSRRGTNGPGATRG